MTRGDVYMLDFGVPFGSEPGMKRSAVIIQSDKDNLNGLNTKIVIPLTSNTVNAELKGNVIVTNSIVYSIKLANKKITKEEFALKISKDIFISTCSIGLGTITQALIPELPAFAFLIGSFIGSLAGSFVYDKGYNKFMSFCCDTGFTCFGLVEQDYKIPDKILKEMKIKTFNFKTFEHKTFEHKSFEFKTFEHKTFKYQTIGLTFMSREVIRISKIGYAIKN